MSAGNAITPVLLCGGSGTRLWPLSRKSYPKQFAAILEDESLFQASARRLSGPGFASPMVVTGSDFRFIVTEQLLEVGLDPGAILLEPEGRNTAPAILAAALHLEAQAPGQLMLVAPSDHVVPNPEAFRMAVKAGVGAARDGQLVTFGIAPTHPETGYGYLELDGPIEDNTTVPLARFVEKPAQADAETMVASSKYAWNSGIFLFRSDVLIEAFHAHAPHLLEPVSAAVKEAQNDLGFLRLAAGPWSHAEDVSIDYAIMEQAKNLSAVPFSAGWSDLGSWNSVRQEAGPNAQGVVTHGQATAIDCRDTLLRSEAESLELVGIGLEGIIAIAMPDAVLVADAARGQDIKLAVNALKDKGANQATAFPKDHRPWGWFESLVVGDRFQVKRIHVHPGAALSLQSHHHRSEHWIVVKGTAKVTIDEEIRLVTENQSVYIPLGTVHRMENPGKVPMVLIEVQTGSYLGEDDITRYEDFYARG